MPASKAPAAKKERPPRGSLSFPWGWWRWPKKSLPRLPARVLGDGSRPDDLADGDPVLVLARMHFTERGAPCLLKGTLAGFASKVPVYVPVPRQHLIYGRPALVRFDGDAESRRRINAWLSIKPAPDDAKGPLIVTVPCETVFPDTPVGRTHAHAALADQYARFGNQLANELAWAYAASRRTIADAARHWAEAKRLAEAGRRDLEKRARRAAKEDEEYAET